MSTPVGLPVTRDGQRVGTVTAAAEPRPDGLVPIVMRMDDGNELQALVEWPAPITWVSW